MPLSRFECVGDWLETGADRAMPVDCGFLLRLYGDEQSASQVRTIGQVSPSLGGSFFELAVPMMRCERFRSQYRSTKANIAETKDRLEAYKKGSLPRYLPMHVEHRGFAPSHLIFRF